jgi:hypothetical protein
MPYIDDLEALFVYNHSFKCSFIPMPKLSFFTVSLYTLAQLKIVQVDLTNLKGIGTG